MKKPRVVLHDSFEIDDFWQSLRRNRMYRLAVSRFLSHCNPDDPYRRLYSLMEAHATRADLDFFEQKYSPLPYDLFQEADGFLGNGTVDRDTWVSEGWHSPKAAEAIWSYLEEKRSCAYRLFLKKYGDVLTFPIPPGWTTPNASVMNAFWKFRPVIRLDGPVEDQSFAREPGQTASVVVRLNFSEDEIVASFRRELRRRGVEEKFERKKVPAQNFHAALKVWDMRTGFGTMMEGWQPFRRGKGDINGKGSLLGTSTASASSDYAGWDYIAGTIEDVRNVDTAVTRFETADSIISTFDWR